jgi:hypothetical protein
MRARDVALASFARRGLEVFARGRKSRRPLCLVYGNCQAEPIRALLASSRAFTEEYETVPIPAVHEVSRGGVPGIQRLVRQAALVIAQPIKDGYRGLPLGTNEMVSLAPGNCRLVRFPTLYYDALYPLQVIVHVRGRGAEREAVSAPVTVYHDLRTLCAASKGLSDEAATHWIRRYRPPERAIHTAGTRAGEEVRFRDCSADISTFDSIVEREATCGPTFLTVNHPALSVLAHIAEGIHHHLGLVSANGVGDHAEPLGTFRTPLERPVLEALGLNCEPRRDWIIKGKRISAFDVMRRQLAWYRRRPDVVQAALDEYADRIEMFQLRS